MELPRREKFGRRVACYHVVGMPAGWKVEWDTTQFFVIAKANIEPPGVVVPQTFLCFEQGGGAKSERRARLNFCRQWLL
jgi:hypothetical protein